MGSVKDLFFDENPSPDRIGKGRFHFSDRYSVFDWGEMPDHIPDKGAALAMMAGYNFERFQSEGIETHYLGMLADGKTTHTTDLSKATRDMEVRLARKPEVTFSEGSYHYEDLRDEQNYLIPLEIVFRNSIPTGSSIRKRAEPSDFGFDFEEWPSREVALENPLIEFSTKLEEKDRYLKDKEARDISGLSKEEFEQLRDVARKVNETLTAIADNRGLDHLDGKIECCYMGGKIVLADVAGTFDENRFSKKGVPISKQVLREWYKINNPRWYKAVREAQKSAGSTGDWKAKVDIEPKSLPPSLISLVGDMYKAGANTWLDKDLFPAPRIENVLEELSQWT